MLNRYCWHKKWPFAHTHFQNSPIVGEELAYEYELGYSHNRYAVALKIFIVGGIKLRGMY